MSSNPDYPVADAAEDLPADDAPVYGTLPRRRVRAAEEPPEIDDSIHTEPAETDPYAYEYEEAAPAPRGSMVPIVISVVAAVVVIGLMAAIMLTPRNAATPTTAGAAGASSTINVGTPAGGGKESPRVGYLAPDFTLTGLDGGTVQLSSYRGVKPVWVNFWATWCPPCRAEMPEMEKLYPTYQAKGIEILGVDVQESQAQVKQFVQQGGYSWKFALDLDGKASRAYYVTGIPTHIFVGRDGVIKDLVVTGLDRASMETKLNKLLTQ
jgi:cytochrome c biogenesis protein CcmG, thiol:disulfide interchange protein DsbE